MHKKYLLFIFRWTPAEEERPGEIPCWLVRGGLDGGFFDFLRFDVDDIFSFTFKRATNSIKYLCLDKNVRKFHSWKCQVFIYVGLISSNSGLGDIAGLRTTNLMTIRILFKRYFIQIRWIRIVINVFLSIDLRRRPVLRNSKRWYMLRSCEKQMQPGQDHQHLW